MLDLERIEYLPSTVNFNLTGVHIRKPAYCKFEFFNNRKAIVIYPIPPNTHINKIEKGSSIIKTLFTVSQLHWVRYVKDELIGNMVSLIVTHRNYRRQNVSFRLWGYCDGNLFDVTPYFRYYYRRYIPPEIPADDILYHDKVSFKEM